MSAVLTPRNIDVDKINAKASEKLPGQIQEYLSIDSVEDTEHSAIYPMEYLNALAVAGLPPHKLSLKLNQPVMLIRNLDPSNGLCNGCRLICRGFSRNLITAEIAIGAHTGTIVHIPRITLLEENAFPFTLSRHQFPLKPAFAMTINKAQGQTLDQASVFLPLPVFSHGQLYVALSRVCSPNNIRVFLYASPNGNSRPAAVTHTKNVVYKEVLQTQ
jgi:ATP-dependent DNA helicase PIF1